MSITYTTQRIITQYIETMEKALTEGDTFMGMYYDEGMLREHVTAKRADRIMRVHGAALSDLGPVRDTYLLGELALVLGY